MDDTPCDPHDTITEPRRVAGPDRIFGVPRWGWGMVVTKGVVYLRFGGLGGFIECFSRVVRCEDLTFEGPRVPGLLSRGR